MPESVGFREKRHNECEKVLDSEQSDIIQDLKYLLQVILVFYGSLKEYFHVILVFYKCFKEGFRVILACFNYRKEYFYVICVCYMG